MGIGKTIQGIGTSELYHPEPAIFMQRLADTFQLNIHKFYIDGEEQVFDGINNGAGLEIAVHAFSSGKKKQITYDFGIPISHSTEKVFDFMFYPNQIFSFSHIPYSSASWRFFIEDMVVGGIKNLLPSYRAVQKLYMPYVELLGCKQLIISTDAGYQWEEDLLFSDNYEGVFTDDTLMDYISESDNIRFISLHEVFAGKHTYDLRKIYEAKGEFDIAFIDHLIH